MRRRKASGLVILLAIALAAGGCSSSSGGGSSSSDGGSGTSNGKTDQPAKRQIIRYGLAATQIGTMDPHQAVIPTDRQLTMMLFDSLLMYQNGDAKAPLRPDLATSLPTAATVGGKQVWTINVRKGVQCPAGEKTKAYELTSADVVYSLKRLRDPKRSRFSSNYESFATIAAEGQWQVKVTMSQPVSSSLFYALISNWGPPAIVCSKAVEAEGDLEFGKHPVGTGPFKLKSYTSGQSIDLVANDSYWQGKPKAAGWKIRFMSDDTARQAALFSGDLDVASGGTQDWLNQVDARKGFKTVTAPSSGMYWIFFNTHVKPLDNIGVRKALEYAIDRKAFVEAAGPKLAKAASSIIDSALPGGISEAHTKAASLDYAYDPAKAKRLLAQAGYPNGFSLNMTTSGDTNSVILQAQLKKVGIKVKIQAVDTTTWSKRVFQGHEPIVFGLAFRPIPQMTFTENYLSASAIVGGARPAQNYTFYAGADSLINAAAHETDPGKQHTLWEQINDKILGDAVVKPIYVSYLSYASTDGFTFGGAEPPKSVPGNWQASYLATR